MSHEIRTPINAVMGMNEIILRESLQAQETPPKDETQIREVFSDISGYAGVISNAGKNLLAIINDILDISRIEAGKMEIRESEYQLSAVLNDVCSLVRFRAQSRNLTFLVDVSETDLPSRGDRFTRRERRHTHTFEWLPFGRLKDEYLYPLFLKTEIFHLPEQLTLRTDRE